MPTVITEPGVYDMPEDEYHADPVPVGSLSASGAKSLLPPNSCPAIFDHNRRNGSTPSRAMELGSAAHAVVLGIGQPMAVVKAKAWTTNAAKEAAEKARAEGMIPVLEKEHAGIIGMADALRRHPTASALLTPGAGKPEQSLFTIDPETGVWLRSRLDWLNAPNADGVTYIVDYKTCNSASPAAISKAVYDYGYYMQAPFYCDRVAQLGLSPGADPVFLFIFQEKKAPYLITVVQLKPDAMEWGRLAVRKAIDVYRRCTEADHWPSYTTDVESIGLPGYAGYQLADAERRGDFLTMEDY